MKHFIITEQVTLKTMLDDEAKYKVPMFQREYSWTDEQIDRFWNDLKKHHDTKDRSPYFFGSMVLIEENSGSEDYRIIDGQQRLSTSITLFAVIRDMLFESEKKIDADNINEFIKIPESETDECQYRVTMSRNNQDFFRSHILDMGVASKKAKLEPKQVPKRNIGLYDAYRILYKEIDKSCSELLTIDEKTQFLISLASRFAKYFVIIKNVIDTPARAYRIFDSLNNRGMRLEETDLVKNYLLEIIDYENGNVEESYEKWLDILSTLDSAKIKESDFLRHYLMAHHEPTGPQEVFDRVADKIHTKEQAEKFIDSLCNVAKIYGELKDPHEEYWKEYKIIECLKAFNALNSKVVFPVLLKGYERFGDDKKLFFNLVNSLLIFFFRSRTICKTSATALESLMNKICKQMRVEVNITVPKIIDSLKQSKKYRTNEEFKFHFKTFDANSKNAFYILKNINNELHGGIKESTMSVEKDKASIEHIMPKIITGTEWEKDLKTKGLNHTEVHDYHNNNLWRIGNLTLLGKIKNSTIKNKSYSEKLASYKNDDTKMTQGLHQWPEWNEESILNRQEMFAEHALKIWSL